MQGCQHPTENSNRDYGTCSVVICTRDRPDDLARCLAAVSRLTYPKFDVLVVDNAPSDGRTRQVAARWGARYMVEPVPGLSRARNCSVRVCDAEVIAYLDDDAVPTPGWLEAIAREFQDPLVMAVAGQVRPLNVDAETYPIHVALGGGSAVVGGPQHRVVDNETPAWFEIGAFGGIGIGANMAFRRRAFEVWRGFDERLDSGVPLHGAGEHYAFFSLLDRGFRVVYSPEAVVYHHLRDTPQEVAEEELRNLASATGYMTFLIAEEPRYRWATVKYLVEGVLGVRRKWRGPRSVPRPRIVPWWRAQLAYLRGPLLYAMCRIQGRPKGSALGDGDETRGSVGPQDVPPNPNSQGPFEVLD